MFLTKVDGVCRFHGTLLQVPYLEIFRLVDGKELADTSCKSVLVVDGYNLLASLVSSWGFIVIEVEEAPLYLRD